MNKRLKRPLAVLMAVVMLLGILPTAAFAAEGEQAGGNYPSMTDMESANNLQLEGADGGDDARPGAEQATPQSEGTIQEVYLNGVSGKDINDGSSTDMAVKTFARAKELLAKNGIIYITGPVTVTGTERWSLEGYGDAKVMRYGDTGNPEGFTSDMVKLESGAALTLEHIVIDGNRAAIDEATQHWGGTIIGCDYDTTSCRLTLNSGCVLQNNYGQQMGSAISGLSHMTLIMNEGAVIQNNSTDGAHYGGGVFLANGSTFTMNGGEIKNNEGNRGGGVALICSDMTMNGGTISGNETYPVLSGSDGYGGGIYIADYAAISGIPGIEEISPGEASFTMIGGSITGNTAQNYGGGILAFPQGRRVDSNSNKDITITISGGEISDNKVTSGSGGGIAMFFDASHLNINSGEIKNNSASTNSGYGGGIILYQVTGDENIAISGGTISGNNAWRGGGVALFAGSKAKMSGIEISGNSASDGGGIYNAGTVEMSAGAISGNTATKWAGGVENAKGATFTMTGGTINSNKATKTSGDRNSIGGGVTNEGTFTMMTGGTLYGNTADFAANDFYNHGNSGQSIGVVVKDEWDSIHQMEIESLSLQSGITRASGTATFTLPDPETFNMGYDAWYHDGPGERYENHPNNPFYESFSKETGEYWLTLGDPDLPPIENVTIEILDMTAYTGGDSMSDKTFPEVRYQFTASEPSVDVEDINFTILGEEYSLAHNLDMGLVHEVSEGVYVIPTSDIEGAFQLPVQFTLNSAAVTDDSVAGVYDIDLDPVFKSRLSSITAEYEGREIENITFESGTLTVRNVSDPDGVIEESVDVAQQVVSGAGEVDTDDGIGIAVIPSGTTYYTNGKEELGLLGDHESVDEQISLLFDELLPGEDGKTTDQLLIAHAATSGYSFSAENSEFKYLDLINENDGNAWVSTDDDVPIQIYWPIPDGVDAGKCDFYVLHFKGLHREYRDNLTEQINSSEIEKLNVQIIDGNAVFTLTGDKDSGCFSPFALVWEERTTPTQDYTVTFLPGDHGTLSGTTSYTVPSGSMFGDSGRTVPTVNEHSNYDFTGWLGSDGKTYTSSQILSLPITSDMTFTAQYKRESSGGGGGGGGTTHYILHYESNGGTEYDDERYAKNTVVDLDKVPTREGYTFTGWYADEELTERITEIKMTSNKTVYAGWEATGVPDLLNGDDHFAYVIGYADGTVRPLDNISRAEVATIIFRLLDPDVRDEYLTTNNTFEDVNEGMWCNTAISTLARLGIVYGRTSTFFDPDASITRAEFAAICARFDDSGIEADSSFTDISGHWAEDEIERAATLGWIRGYTDGTFRPNNLITRAEAMTMINRVLQRLPEDEDDLLDDMNVWPDNQPDDWYYLAVQEATNSHDFDRKSDGVHEHWTEMTADPDWKQYE